MKISKIPYSANIKSYIFKMQQITGNVKRKKIFKQIMNTLHRQIFSIF